MDDYYGLLGVDPNSEPAAIREAYREKKAALDAKGDKNGVAALNRAWNVLSDPYQRGRYDADRESVAGNGEATEVVVDEPPRRRRLFEPAAPRDRNAPPAQPTIDVPPGTRFPEPRKRVIAMVIDLTVLLVFFVGGQLLAGQYNDSNHEAELDGIEAIDDQIEALDEEKDDLPDNAPAREVDAIDDQIDVLEDERGDLTDEISPAYRAAYGGAFGLGLLYLVVPSAFTGRTLGKKITGLKVVRQDGRRLGFVGALYRYGLLVIGAYVLSQLVPLLGIAIVLFVVLGWMRNPNQQGMHDRVTKTIVVTEAGNA